MNGVKKWLGEWFLKLNGGAWMNGLLNISDIGWGCLSRKKFLINLALSSSMWFNDAMFFNFPSCLSAGRKNWWELYYGYCFHEYLNWTKSKQSLR